MESFLKYLLSVILYGVLTGLNKGAFYNCYSINNVNYTGTIDQWVQINFYGSYSNSYSNPLCYAKNFYINNELVTEANITTATEINSYAFIGYDLLTRVTLGDSVTNIGEYAFNGCNSLMSVTIGKNVDGIGGSAFGSCYKLVEVINNNNDLIITTGSSDNGYIGCYALNVKTGGISDIVDKDGYLFYTYDSVNYLLGYVGNETSLTLPENYNGQNYEIYKYAFEYCSSLTSVTIPNSVTSIGYGAFSGCSSLTSVTFENPTDWYVEQYSDDISLTLTDAAQNATYLTNTYSYYYWKRG